jgi:glycosyltransferase involved in cell wall biosynthesis
MPLYLYYDAENVVRLVSKDLMVAPQFRVAKTNLVGNLVGRKVRFGNPEKGIKLALICNWGDACGISTYTKFLMDTLAPKVSSLKIFSEGVGPALSDPDVATKYDISYCWKRGESMQPLARQVIDWRPTVVLIQHEFGLFPKANSFLPLMESLRDIPTVVTLHSVYEHKDKSVCTAAMPNIIVHSESGKNCLVHMLGHTHQNIWVVPHGCVDFGDVQPNWNFFGVDYPIIQFGFGFDYKGVDTALEAIKILKTRNDKFKDVFYCYLCSENPHTKNINNTYYNFIRSKIEQLGLNNNATIQRGFYSEEELNQHLRTGRMAIFPYKSDPKNVVRGASGANRIAMANNLPVVVSNSPMFDDMEGVLPRPSNASELADTIERLFTNEQERASQLKRQRQYIASNTWEVTAGRYLNILREAIDKANNGVILVDVD